MKYVVALSLLLVAAAFPGAAQLKGFGIGPYIETGWPAGDGKDSYKQGFGAGLFADIKLPGKIGLTGSAGYMQFNAKSNQHSGNEAPVPDLKAFPVRAGLKYRPVPFLYLKMEGGAANFTGDYSGSAFIISPGVGIRLLGFDLQAKYEAWLKEGMNNSFWGVRAGISF